MSILLDDGRISTKIPFSKIEALRTNGWNLDEVKAGSHSGRALSVTSANSSNARALKTKLHRTEPCFITKRFTVTHERAHWVNAVRDDPYTRRIVVSILKPVSSLSCSGKTGRSSYYSWNCPRWISLKQHGKPHKPYAQSCAFSFQL
jgi:hypothetical protein